MPGAIITADIVNSTKLSRAEYKKIIKLFTPVLEQQQYEFFRGDSFQVVFKSAEDALRILLQLRTIAIKLSSEETPADVRASIGIGNMRLPVKSLKTNTGEVFVLSGRAFDKLSKDERLVIVCNEKNKAVNLGLNIVSRFVDYLFQRLTVKQAAVVYELLLQRTQTEAAKRLRKTQATVNKHTQSAGWPEIEKLLTDYQNLVQLIEP